jgi:hypothetical protein
LLGNSLKHKIVKENLTFLLTLTVCILATGSLTISQQLERLSYNNPGLTVDLAVGLRGWPLPMDYNGNGLTDLVLVCSDLPHDGVYFFENTGREDIETGMPVFAVAKRIGDARKHLRPDPTLDRAANVRISYKNGEPVVLTPGNIYPDFKNTGFDNPEVLPVERNFHGYDRRVVRADQWEYVDFNGNGVLDLVVGIGYWGEHRGGGYNEFGQWTGGPLRGWIYLLKNSGTNENPVYEEPRKLKTTDGTYIDVYGWPSPNFADFNGNGKLDIICGEFRDGFTFFENVGTREVPLYAPGRPLTYNDKRLVMDLCMVIPVAYDFTGNGYMDLIVGDEAGRVALMEHTGEVVEGMPKYLPPRFFQQEADKLNFGALSTPVGFDWNGNGRDDIITGNTEGQIAVIENLGSNPPKWAAPRLLKADDEVIRIIAGPNGSIRGPEESKWGYTTLTVADWNHNGLPDLIVNSIWGKVIWYENIGTRTEPKLAAAQPVEVLWDGEVPKPAWNWWDPEGNALVTQWRTTPVAVDWTGNGLTDLIMLDHEGYLALFKRIERNGEIVLLPGERVFRLEGEEGSLQLNSATSGGSGRRKIAIVDFDGDDRLDLLLNSQNASFLKNMGVKNGVTVFRDMGILDERQLAGHTTSPATIDLTGDGIPGLLIGAEDGFLYYRSNPFINSDK